MVLIDLDNYVNSGEDCCIEDSHIQNVLKNLKDIHGLHKGYNMNVNMGYYELELNTKEKSIKIREVYEDSICPMHMEIRNILKENHILKILVSKSEDVGTVLGAMFFKSFSSTQNGYRKLIFINLEHIHYVISGTTKEYSEHSSFIIVTAYLGNNTDVCAWHGAANSPEIENICSKNKSLIEYFYDYANNYKLLR